ncbi:MAG: FMN-binding protein [Candidatus Brocadiae bacterium]|nr:FMN-binding protein [Candidatus Brocadiia bacterium]
MTDQQRPSQAKRNIVRGVIVLACICLASGAGVGVLYHRLKGDIEEKQRQVFRDSLADVLGAADDYATVGEYAEDTAAEDKVYVKAADGGVLYAAIGAARGYQSQVKVIVSVEASGPGVAVVDDPVIRCMAVVSSLETPGLGENIKAVEKSVSVWGALAGRKAAPERAWFQQQFSGKRLSDLIVEKRKDTAKIEAVTGATISSKAAVEAARQAVVKIIERTAETYGK